MFDLYTEETALGLFAQTNSDGLQNAALLLGGRPWLRRLQRLMDDLRGGHPCRRVLGEAHALLGLLNLEQMHDPERPETAYFAELDPAMPYLDQICLLTEALEVAIAETPACVLVPVFHEEARI